MWLSDYPVVLLAPYFKPIMYIQSKKAQCFDDVLRYDVLSPENMHLVQISSVKNTCLPLFPSS